MKRIITAAAAAGVLVFGMSGCGSAEQRAPDHNASTPSPADTASPDNDNANDAAPEPSPDPVDMSVAFGQTQTWQDNVSVTVKKPTEFARGEWTMGGEGYPHLVKYPSPPIVHSPRANSVGFFTVTDTLKKPTEFARGEWTMGGEGYPHLVKFDVTVTNG